MCRWISPSLHLFCSCQVSLLTHHTCNRPNALPIPFHTFLISHQKLRIRQQKEDESFFSRHSRRLYNGVENNECAWILPGTGHCTEKNEWSDFESLESSSGEKQTEGEDLSREITIKRKKEDNLWGTLKIHFKRSLSNYNLDCPWLENLVLRISINFRAMRLLERRQSVSVIKVELLLTLRRDSPEKQIKILIKMFPAFPSITHCNPSSANRPQDEHLLVS